MSVNELAPCGIDCVNCEMFEKNNQTAVWERFAAAIGKRAEEVACKGCRLQPGCTVHEGCETLACVNGKQLEYCFECGEFPCARLMPMRDKADRAPHNMKVYNLCRIELLGEAGFLAEAALNRRKYYRGRLVIGAGPRLDVE